MADDLQLYTVSVEFEVPVLARDEDEARSVALGAVQDELVYDDLIVTHHVTRPAYKLGYWDDDYLVYHHHKLHLPDMTWDQACDFLWPPTPPTPT